MRNESRIYSVETEQSLSQILTLIQLNSEKVGQKNYPTTERALYCVLRIVYCVLCIAYCVLRIVYCVLCIVLYCILVLLPLPLLYR